MSAYDSHSADGSLHLYHRFSKASGLKFFKRYFLFTTHLRSPQLANIGNNIRYPDFHPHLSYRADWNGRSQALVVDVAFQWAINFEHAVFHPAIHLNVGCGRYHSHIAANEEPYRLRSGYLGALRYGLSRYLSRFYLRCE